MNNEMQEAHKLIRDALGYEGDEDYRFELYALEIETRAEQLAAANKHLQEAWKMQADMQIVIDRYKNFPQN